MTITRRQFCSSLGMTAISLAAPISSLALTPPDVAAIDRKRVLSHATRYLREPPITVTSYFSPRSAGDRHDYFSEGDYWWPDPKNLDGPYIQRDGLSNPDNFNQHRLALIRLSVQMPALTAAWKITHENRYAEHAVTHLRAWFLDPNTWMNPNLEHAQAVHGRSNGRGTGIIDTLHLVEVVKAAAFLEQSNQLTDWEAGGLRKWFTEYLSWMIDSENGRQERDAKNNHGTCWVAQVAEFATFVRDNDATGFCRKRFKETLIPEQIAVDGSFPLELKRTKPYGYCIFNLDAMATVCRILSTSEDNLFRFVLPDGRGFAKALAFMYPFLADKNSWPYPSDVEYWKGWPVRQPSLLFGGIALNRPEYIRLWRRLNPDPTVPEIIRNFPIRQPALWI